ncbi:MAG: response regulator [Planctomycetes bacterium]|nr:response regulator [Planctomycetota bacterium]
MSTVYVLEDNALVRRYLTELLHIVGKHDVQAFAAPQELMTAMQHKLPQLLILDINLADAKLDGEAMDGLILSRRFKESLGESAPVVMLLSAHALPGDEDDFLQSSLADAYQSKPILDEDQFLQRLTQLLKG